jgi:hypothetical protein
MSATPTQFTSQEQKDEDGHEFPEVDEDVAELMQGAQST